MFDADRPILNSTHDQLGRTTFSKYLARCLLDHKDPQSLVVGLYGGWGVGKTSIINLIMEELRFAETNLEAPEKPILLNFSPWSYSGQNQLIYSFFRRLSSTLRQVEYLENADRIIYLLELYVSYFTHKPIPKALRPKQSLLQTLKKGSDDVYAWESGQDLTLIKAELNALLQQQKHKIIIIIDNISRLYDYEIKQIFQIVKSMGDYSNTVYLLSFDKDHVIKALNKMDGFGGEEYVEKVVQLPFEIPPILQHNLENIFLDRIGALIKTIPEDTWNNDYWIEIYFNSLKYFFENGRDITRYINTVNFGYSRLHDVVNPVDYFAITALEVFAPSIYSGIRDNKDLFTDLLEGVYEITDSQREKDKARSDEILSRACNTPKDIIKELMMQLFPRIRHIYQPNLFVYHSPQKARKLKRICSPDIFDVYFRISIQAGQIPQTEFETILALAKDSDAFDQALTRLNQDERIVPFLNRLDKRTLNALPLESTPAIVQSLFDNGDLFPQQDASHISLSMPKRIHRIIHTLIRKCKSSEDRYNILADAITKSDKSIHVIVNVMNYLSHEHNEDLDTFIPLEYRDITPQQLRSLQQLTASKIKEWAENNSLFDHPQLLPLLTAWRDWGSEDDCLNHVSEMTATDKGFISFLIACLNEPIENAMHDYQKNPAWEKHLDDISSFISLTKAEEHAKQLFEDGYFEKLREKEQLAILIFLDLLKAPTTKTIPSTSA